MASIGDTERCKPVHHSTTHGAWPSAAPAGAGTRPRGATRKRATELHDGTLGGARGKCGVIARTT